MTRAIVLFAHGARDARWAEPFEAIAARVRAAEPEAIVVLAFLELMQPSLGSACDDVVARGAGAIEIVPLFLGRGGHLRHDLPPLVESVRAAHPGIAVRLHGAIGEHPEVLDAMAAAVRTLAASHE